MHTAFVRGVIRRSTSSGSRLGTSRETISANTGVAPQYSAAAAVAANVNEGTITSSPGPTPSARYARCRAAVQLESATAWRAPSWAAKASSKAAVRGPIVSQPERSVRVTASMSSSARRRSNRGTVAPPGAPLEVGRLVPVGDVIGIGTDAYGERRDDLPDPGGHGPLGLKAERTGGALAGAARERPLDRYLLLGVQGHRAQVAALVDRDRRIGH